MKKLVALFMVILLSGCSSRDAAIFNSAMSDSGYGGCDYEDLYIPSDRDGDLSIETSIICNTAFVTLRNHSDSIEYDCDIKFNSSMQSRYLEPHSSAYVEFSSYGSGANTGFSCEVYNRKEYISSQNSSFKYKVVNGNSYVSLKNKKSSMILCDIFDEYDDLLEENLLIDSNKWSKWIKNNTDTVKTECY